MDQEKKIKQHNSKGNCKICNHPERENIDLDIKHYIPWRIICERYNVNDANISNHCIGLDLYNKRNRKAFYQYLMDHYTISKISAENALEAGKQLDRIERVIVDNPTPSNITVVYGWGKELEQRNAGSQDRLQPITDAKEIPPKPEEV